MLLGTKNSHRLCSEERKANVAKGSAEGCVKEWQVPQPRLLFGPGIFVTWCPQNTYSARFGSWMLARRNTLSAPSYCKVMCSNLSYGDCVGSLYFKFNHSYGNEDWAPCTNCYSLMHNRPLPTAWRFLGKLSPNSLLSAVFSFYFP